MANEHGLFWNSQNGDRVYDANDFSEWLKKFYTTGVFNGDLEVTAAGGMTVSVSSGYVNIEGKVKFFSTPTTLTLATASGKYGRIDTVVAECNYTDREIKLKVVTGAYSVSPTATAPVRTAAAYQLVLAQIDVAAGAAEITQKNITDKRMDSNVCGLVTGTVSQIDFSTVKAQFDSWFDDVKGTLDTDAAGNLKNQIDAINDKIGTTDISSIGDGTETGAISANASNISQTQAAITALNNDLTNEHLRYIFTSNYIVGTGTFFYTVTPPSPGYIPVCGTNGDWATNSIKVVQVTRQNGAALVILDSTLASGNGMRVDILWAKQYDS